jgi:hypothetical protein
MVLMNLLLYQKHVEKLDKSFDIPVFLSTLTKMAIFCSNFIEMQGLDKLINPLILPTLAIS